MGLFSKKKVVCERCGKEYEVRVALGAHICDECQARENQKKEDVRGYVDYAFTRSWPKYSEAQLDQIVAHRNQILEKYRVRDGISKGDLISASARYKQLTDDEAEDVLNRITKSAITTNLGAAYTGDFFMPTAYERTVVDVKDVFAVGFTRNYKLDSSNGEPLLCAVFTNDPYISAFPVVYLGKHGLFEVFKSKKGRQGVTDIFESMCPNLTYPVQDLKQLTKLIKQGGSVKGNMDQKVMLDLISDATYSVGVFDVASMHKELYSSSASLLDQYGYIQDVQIYQILQMDKMFNRNYWNKQITRISK